jgi:hypothetical protein
MHTGWANQPHTVSSSLTRGGANSVSLWMFLRTAAERSAEEATHDRQAGAK